MKRRDTLDLANPNASGTASAAASYSRHDKPAQHAAKQADIAGARRLQLRVRRQWQFGAGLHITHARYGDRHLLIREKDRARLRAPPRDPDVAIGMRIPRTGQRRDFLLQRLLDRSEAQRDQRLNHGQRHRAIV
jgi:hypothetical protein